MAASPAGFTIVELMMVLAIIAILAIVSIPYYQKFVEKARMADVIDDLHYIDKGIKIYKIVSGNFPPSLETIGMQDLRDHWGNPYMYLRIEDSDDAKGKGKGKGKQRRDRYLNPVNTDYDLYSMGADGKTAAEFNAKKARDDIVRANNGDYYGLASDY